MQTCNYSLNKRWQESQYKENTIEENENSKRAGAEKVRHRFKTTKI